uniref:14-3-3 domain-containing protein n=1 Tax=Bionectria ochroleuca TaxID=29856 RepID=A0A0B7KRN5_BIOOC
MIQIIKRNLAIAYSRMVCTRRSSLRTILSIEQKKQPRVNEEHIATTRGYRKKIENELEIVCSDILDLLDGSLIPNAGTVESKAFYYKMKGDYSRYLTEFTLGEKYTAAITTDFVQTEFAATYRLQLSLALDISVFYYEILNLYDYARHLAKDAFDNAIIELDGLAKEPDDKSISTMYILRDNLSLWISPDNSRREALTQGKLREKLSIIY